MVSSKSVKSTIFQYLNHGNRIESTNVGQSMPCLPAMTGNGKHTTYVWWWLGDGLWHCFTHITIHYYPIIIPLIPIVIPLLSQFIVALSPFSIPPRTWSRATLGHSVIVFPARPSIRQAESLKKHAVQGGASPSYKWVISPLTIEVL